MSQKISSEESSTDEEKRTLTVFGPETELDGV